MDTRSRGNPDSTLNHDQAINKTVGEVEPHSMAEVQQTAGGSGTTSVSSSYQDLVLTIDNKIITAKGNARFDHVKSLLEVHIDRRFSCKICGHESQDRTNLVTHIGYIHGAPPCESCKEECFGVCIIKEHNQFMESHNTESPRGKPTSTHPLVTVINSLAK